MLALVASKTYSFPKTYSFLKLIDIEGNQLASKAIKDVIAVNSQILEMVL